MVGTCRIARGYLFFCAPLFVGLSGQDFENHEAIYSYAVDRILDTGDWLTPRLIPYDYPFLEKPPLKFWMIAAAVRTGLLPRDEFGFRFLDALLGALAFLYVFRIATALAGPLAGVASCFVLFTCDRLLFEHGLRGNNMEAALVLSYCAGAYHFARWNEGSVHARLHAVAAACSFVLAVMTKFVAAVFLPAIWAVSLVLRGGWRNEFRDRRRDMIVAAVVACAATAPWFAYQSVHQGADLWKLMFGVHVVQRFTTGLDPTHLQPWNYYFTELWEEFSRSGTQWIALAGLGVLAVRARREWRPRLLLIWAVLPIVAISFVSSKVFHYVYPFLPPLAIGAGAAVAAIVRLLARPTPGPARSSGRQRFDDVLLAGAIAATALAAWTVVAGPVRWSVGDTLVFRNSSIWRPLLIGAVLFIGGGHRGRIYLLLQIAVIPVMLPFSAYLQTIDRLNDIDRPLHALRECAVSMQVLPEQTRVYLPYDDLRTHSYYYYLHPLAPWAGNLNIETQEVQQHLPPEENKIIIFPRDDYGRFVRNLTEFGVATVQGDLPGMTSVVLPFSTAVVVLLPNELQGCAESIKAAGQGVETRMLTARE